MPPSLSFARSSRAGAAVLLLQRAPLLRILPEARVLTSSTFSDAVRWTVMAVAGLGAFDSVAGATEIAQLLPSPGSDIVPGVAGDPLTFVWQAQGTGVNASHHSISGNLPAGMTPTNTPNSNLDSASGIPAAAGDYPITITAWKEPDFTGTSVSKDFTIRITNPPPPSIQTPPAGGLFSEGAFVKLTAQQTGGRTFTWSLNDAPLEPEMHTLFAKTAARRYRKAPAADPGTSWRSGAAFDDATWTSVSGGVGYDTSTTPVDYNPQLAAANGNIRTLMLASPAGTSLHMRLPFTLPAGAALSAMKLSVQCDDGFVAWINGTEVASQNKPANLLWNSAAGGQPADAAAVAFREIDISAFAHTLREGANLLAVQAMNANTSSSDFLFNCELTAGIGAPNSSTLILTTLQTGQSGSYKLDVANAAATVTASAGVYIPPLIIQQPASETIAHGASTILNTTATGTEPISYQWYEGTSGDTSRPIASATGESYTTPALTATTSFWVRATNPGASSDSGTAIITVQPPALHDFSHWAAAQFTPAQLADPLISGPEADPDGDGFTNSREYALGTLPLAASPSPLLIEAPATLSFTASAAAGPGYLGRTRVYTLEQTNNLTSGPWTAVPGFENITAAGQTLTHTISAPAFYRLRVTLNP